MPQTGYILLTPEIDIDLCFMQGNIHILEHVSQWEITLNLIVRNNNEVGVQCFVYITLL